MDYFFSRLGRGFRYSATILGSLACGVVIVLGGLGISTIAIPICGGIALIPMGMVLFENAKILRDMEDLVIKFKADVKNLRETNDKLKTNVQQLGTEVSQLSVTKNELMEETTRLEGMIDEAEVTIDNLSQLTEDYKKNIEHLSELTRDYKNNNDELRQKAESLLLIKTQYENENQKLNNSILEITNQLAILTSTKEDYEKELSKLKENNNDLSETATSLKTELQNINNAYSEAKDVIETLLRSKRVLNDIYDGMVKTEAQTEENVGTMSKLLNIFGMERSKEMFKILDKNGDNLLTTDEFIEGILNQETK